MKIIDWLQKGNVVRFILGDDNCADYCGDDWDDVPFEHNAGGVYDEFIEGYKDVTFPFDMVVMDASYGFSNSPFSKDDMKNRKTPCIVVIPEIEMVNCYHDEFAYALANDKSQKFYFGDSMEALNEQNL